jgi:hypothetical protein
MRKSAQPLTFTLAVTGINLVHESGKALSASTNDALFHAPNPTITILPSSSKKTTGVANPAFESDRPSAGFVSVSWLLIAQFPFYRSVLGGCSTLRWGLTS